jgi:hypothetical protein
VVPSDNTSAIPASKPSKASGSHPLALTEPTDAHIRSASGSRSALLPDDEPPANPRSGSRDPLSSGSRTLSSSERPRVLDTMSQPKERFPLEAAVLTCILFLGIFMFLQVFKPPPLAARIQTEVSQGRFDDASRQLHFWKTSGIKESQKELFDSLCMQVGQAYVVKRNFHNALDCFNMVSDTGTYAEEARRQGRRCRQQM